MSLTSNVVLLHTVRGGKDPADYWHVLDHGLAEILDKDDPWKTLGEFEDAGDPRVRAALLVSRVQAEEWCAANRATVVGVMEAVGY